MSPGENLKFLLFFAPIVQDFPRQILYNENNILKGAFNHV